MHCWWNFRKNEHWGILRLDNMSLFNIATKTWISISLGSLRTTSGFSLDVIVPTNESGRTIWFEFSIRFFNILEEMSILYTIVFDFPTFIIDQSPSTFSFSTSDCKVIFESNFNFFLYFCKNTTHWFVTSLCFVRCLMTTGKRLEIILSHNLTFLKNPFAYNLIFETVNG